VMETTRPCRAISVPSRARSLAARWSTDAKGRRGCV
jgi:hypothetical protein